MFNEKIKKVALSATAITALSAGAVAAQEACTNYTVQDGDTMATIAIAAYGTSNYQPIFNANRNEITNPNALEPGLVLALPCEDGSLPNGQSAQEIIAQTVYLERLLRHGAFGIDILVIGPARGHMVVKFDRTDFDNPVPRFWIEPCRLGI